MHCHIDISNMASLSVKRSIVEICLTPLTPLTMYIMVLGKWCCLWFWKVCVFMCVCVLMYVLLCFYECACVCLCLCMCMFVFVPVYGCVYACVWLCCVGVCRHAYVCIYAVSVSLVEYSTGTIQIFKHSFTMLKK